MPCTMLEAIRVVLASPVALAISEDRIGEERCAHTNAQAGTHACRAFADAAFNADDRAEERGPEQTISDGADRQHVYFAPLCRMPALKWILHGNEHWYAEAESRRVRKEHGA